jgi:hypothetical protein
MLLQERAQGAIFERALYDSRVMQLLVNWLQPTDR